MTMPSWPIGISVILATPFWAQVSISLSLILRDAPAMSGVASPTPSQNSLRPPPVPVASTTGDFSAPCLASASVTVVENG